MWYYLFYMTLAQKFIDPHNQSCKWRQIAHPPPSLTTKNPTSLTKHRASIVSHHCMRHHNEHQIMAMPKRKGSAKSKACQATQASQKKERELKSREGGKIVPNHI